MKFHLLVVGLVIGCAGSSEDLGKRASDPNFWLQELRDDAHPDEQERATMIQRYLDQAPDETKAELVKLTEFLSPCSQRLRLADTRHRLEQFDQAIVQYQQLLVDHCKVPAVDVARRIAFASIEALPDVYPSKPEVLDAYLDRLIEVEHFFPAAERGEINYEIAAVQYMQSKPEAVRLHALADRALAQLTTGKLTDIEGVLRTIVILSNTGGASLVDIGLLEKAARCDNAFRRRFGYSAI